MSTSVAISSAALASSIAAQQAAREAQRASCVGIELGYRPELASPAAKHQYAQCIEILYPQPSTDLSGGELLAAKSAVAILLLVFVLGLVWGWRESCWESGFERGFSVFMHGLGATISVLGVGLAGLLLVAGVAYVFN